MAASENRIKFRVLHFFAHTSAFGLRILLGRDLQDSVDLGCERCAGAYGGSRGLRSWCASDHVGCGPKYHLSIGL